MLRAFTSRLSILPPGLYALIEPYGMVYVEKAYIDNLMESHAARREGYFIDPVGRLVWTYKLNGVNR
jgi:hypothetical protein